MKNENEITLLPDEGPHKTLIVHYPVKFEYAGVEETIICEEFAVVFRESDEEEESEVKVYRCYDIKWDTDGEEVDLPTELIVELDEEDLARLDADEILADEISNITGFCHGGFLFERIEAPPVEA